MGVTKDNVAVSARCAENCSKSASSARTDPYFGRATRSLLVGLNGQRGSSDFGLEIRNDFPRLDQKSDAVLNRGDGYSLGLREPAAPIVINRATVRAEGMRLIALASIFLIVDAVHACQDPRGAA